MDYKSTYPKLVLNSTIPFGKYKGRIVVSVIKSDPGYVDWLLMKTETKFTREVVEKLNEAMYGRSSWLDDCLEGDFYDYD